MYRRSSELIRASLDYFSKPKHLKTEDNRVRLNLAEHLSPIRHVGVYAMFEFDLMKQKALQAEKETVPA